jgi:hypothetical protein
MAVDVSDRLGATQLAGAFVVGKGFIKKKALGNAGAGVGGLIGGAISAAGEYAASKTVTDHTDSPELKGVGYLAVTADEVVLFKTKPGFRAPSVSDEIARLPRGEIQTSEFDSGYVSHLKLHLLDGGIWEFSVQRAYKKSGIAVAETLGANKS